MKNWLDIVVSLYSNHSDNTGRPASLRDILLCQFAMPRILFGKKQNDSETLIELKHLDKNAPDYEIRKKALKGKLQCYTPAALLETKEKNNVKEINKTGLMQLDFDYANIKDYNIRELMKSVFALPFICFCGMSCSGYGFYAIALIAEPEKLSEYFEHVSEIFLCYRIKLDPSKGKRVQDLRYVSYDCNMMIKENPEPLQITKFRKKEVKKTTNTRTNILSAAVDSPFVKSQLKKIKEAIKGSRFETVQQVAFTLGGLGDEVLLNAIKCEIENNLEFKGEESKYCKVADDCFAAGVDKPLVLNNQA